MKASLLYSVCEVEGLRSIQWTWKTIVKLLFCLALLYQAQVHYARSLGAGTSQFDVQVRELFTSFGLIAGSLLVLYYACSELPRIVRFGCIFLVAVYFYVVMANAKVPKATNLTRSMLNILALCASCIIVSIVGYIYACFKVPVLRRSRFGLPLGLWIALVLFSMIAFFYFGRVFYFSAIWKRGLRDAYMDDTVSKCQFSSPKPWISAFPDRTLNFWAGAAYCESDREPQLAKIHYSNIVGANIIQVTRCPPSQRPFIITEWPSKVSDRDAEWLKDRHYDEWLEEEHGQRPTIIEHIADGRDVTQLTWETHADVVQVQCGTQRQVLAHIAPIVAPPKSPVLKLVKRSASQAPNVVLLLLDSLSRPQAFRAVPKTMAVLSKHNAFQFFRMHSVGHATSQNMPRLMRGKAVCDQPGDKTKNDFVDSACDYDFQQHPYIWQRYHAVGYKTMSMLGECELFNTRDGLYHVPLKVAMKTLDHRPSVLACDEDYDGLLRTNFQGAYSFRRRCINDKPFHRYMFDIGSSLLDGYASTIHPVFGYMHMQENHEGSGEVIKAVDGDMAAWMDSFLQAHSRDTIVIVLADHGAHMGPNYMFTDSGWLEHKLPFFSMVVPPQYLAARPHLADTLKHNEQMLLTHDDIHATLVDIAEYAATGKEAVNAGSTRMDRATSLFSYKVGDRSCESLWITPDRCACNGPPLQR
jgi:hypothetical protein